MNYDTLVKMRNILQDIKANKPNDRSEQDRYTAIAITDLEKLIAFFEKYVVRGETA